MALNSLQYSLKKRYLQSIYKRIYIGQWHSKDLWELHFKAFHLRANLQTFEKGRSSEPSLPHPSCAPE